MDYKDYTGVSAKLAYDESAFVHPKTMRDGQFIGSMMENLAEFAGRVCYNSFGKGRNSKLFHEHILESRHLNVYEHCQLHVKIPLEDITPTKLAWHLRNRPGIYIGGFDDDWLFVSLNARAAIEFLETVEMTTINIETIRNVFAAAMLQEMRMVSELFFESSGILYPEEFTGEYWHQRDNQETEWVSLLVSCSRNCSHEFVRHRYRTAVSQRSTRYCDEAQSMFVEHPLSCCDQVWDSIPYSLRERICERAENIGYMQRTAYSELCYIYENYLRGVGMRGTPARKQARGAARAILPSCLETEFLFSASVSQWKRMLNARLTDAADAEIRMLFAKILDELQHSNYANRFDNVILVPAEDDFGVVLAEPFDIESKD